MAEAQKGIFDHLAEYLLQPPAAGPASPPAAPATQEESRETRTGMDQGGQTLVFVETAEKLVVEKEVFVREEVVLSKLVENHVQEIEDKVRRTEVEVERIPPEEAERMLERSAPTDQPAAASPERLDAPPAPAAPVQALKAEAQAPPPASEVQPAKPVQVAAAQAHRTDQHSATWWLWFGLILCAAVLIAFAAGQFLGSASG
jgi:hypothetical protein